MSSPDQPLQPERPEPHAGTPSATSRSNPDNAAQPAHHAAKSVETVVGEATVTVRRAPRYFNFMLLGGIVGAVLALILTFAFPENPDFGRAQVFGFLLLAFVAFGVALGCIVAIVLDRFVGRTGTAVVADRLGAHTPDTAQTVGTAHSSAGQIDSAGPPDDESPSSGSASE